MARQKAKVKRRPVGFYTEDGKTKPIFAPKGRGKVRRVSKEPFLGGRKARLSLSMETEDGVINVDTDIRWETMKTEPLIKTEYRTADGVLVFKRYLGPKKRLAYVDVDGKERDPGEVLLVQVMPDGERREIKPFTATKKIKAEALGKQVVNEFLPHSYLELWADSTEGQEQLRRLAWYLLKTGKVAAVEKFVKAKGRKAYVGFIYPVTDPDHPEEFGLEMMVSENRRRRRRWMPSEPAEVGDEEEEEEEAEVPKLW